jgi:hypothetical protein
LLQKELHMRQEMKWIVLARIPNLGGTGEGASFGESPKSTGRILDQVISFKLLAALTVGLIAVALIPMAVHKNTSTSEAVAVHDVSARQAPTAASAAAPLVYTPSATPVQTVTPGLATAPPIAVPMPCNSPASDSVPNRPSSANGVDTAMMSVWPNPEHAMSASGQDAAGVKVNQAMSIRSEEYQR